MKIRYCVKLMCCFFGEIYIKTVSIAVIAFLGFNFVVVPSLQALTVEEAAGKKEKNQATYYDELSSKAQERRDEGGYKEKDPRLACMLSLIVPGGGQIYLREDLKGITFCLLTGTSYAAAGYYLYLALFGDNSGTERKSKLIISGLLFVVGAIIHIVGVVEAYNNANDINEKRFYYGENNSESPYVARIVYEH
jgi:hypothetical protein